MKKTTKKPVTLAQLRAAAPKGYDITEGHGIFEWWICVARGVGHSITWRHRQRQAARRTALAGLKEMTR